MAVTIKDYNQVPWEQIVYYDETSSTFIRYINGNNSKNHNRRKANDEAGCRLFKDGTAKYASLKYQGKNYLIHRIVYILHYKVIDNKSVVNHIDFNTHNNSIRNLELCSFRENLSRTKVSRKLALNSRNCSGYNGVHELTKDNGYKLYKYAVAIWTSFDGKNNQKLFSYEKYGKDVAWCLAIEFRKSMEIILEKEGRL